MNTTAYPDLSLDASSAIAHARATGSVGCTYNGTSAMRLYTNPGGFGGTPKATNLWIITLPDGSQTLTEAS